MLTIQPVGLLEANVALVTMTMAVMVTYLGSGQQAPAT